MVITLNYLTIQDIIWVNLQVTPAICSYNYKGLEEAANAQYGYGKTMSACKQALQLARCLVAKQPFTQGNRSTALLSLLLFLRINGHELNVPDRELYKYFERILLSEISESDFMQHCLSKEVNDHDHRSRIIEPITYEILKQNSETFETLKRRS